LSREKPTLSSLSKKRTCLPQDGRTSRTAAL
jgi:hypothetical protein